MKKILLTILLFIGLNSYAAMLSGKVIHISDGDTVHLLTPDKVTHKIRLNDIDAPESKQAFGNKSKENLKKYIYQKNVVVEYKNKDRYGRILGTIYLNNKDINLQQVKDGYAWVYVGTQRIWPPRALTLGHLTHNDLATVRISK